MLIASRATKSSEKLVEVLIQWKNDTADGSEILHHLELKRNLVNNGRIYQPQLVNAGFLNHQQYC